MTAMKDLLVFAITAVLLCTHKSIRPAVAQRGREVCVEPTYQNGTGTEITNCSNHTTWTSILFSPLRYFTSYTKLYFVPGIYHLDRHLQINGVKKISIIGQEEVTILCPTNTSNISLSISNSFFVELKNINFKNCKMNIKHVQFTNNNGPLSTGISAAMFLYNVTSLNIANIVLENCYCHGIFGYNVLGTLHNVSIFYTSRRDVSNQRIAIGGFVLVYFDDISQNHNYAKMQKVLIDGCAIYNLLNTASSNESNISDDLYTSVIGIGFHQHTYLVKVKLFNITVKNVYVNQGPIVMIVYDDSIINSVHIFNSSFSEIVSKQQPIISVWTISSIIESSADFALIHCKVLFSTARSILHVVQPVEKAHVKINITIYFTKFECNKARTDFWNLKFKRTYQASVSIVKSNFTSNWCSGHILWFSNIDNVSFIGDNMFYNNSVKYSDKAIIRCDRTLLMFKGYNEFSSNTANIIISLLQKYIGLYENATISFLQNKAHTYITSKTKSAVIKFKKTETVYYNCLFQFFSKSNLDTDFMNDNTVWYFNVTFKGNKNYNSTIFGTQLNSCSWDKQSAFKKLTPGYVYKRVLHFNVTNEKIVNKEGVTFCYCEKTTNVDCIKDHFGPVYPGQKIPISLKQSVLSSVSTPVPLLQRHFGLLQTINEQPRCDLQSVVPLHDPKLAQLISLQCTALLYRVLNTNNNMSCYVQFSFAYSTNIWYSMLYFIEFKKACPLGFDYYNGLCECNKQLKAVMPSLACDIDRQTFICPGHSWIGLSKSKQNILYVKDCDIFCSKIPTTIQLEFPDTQCRYNRTGTTCAQCSPGLDAMFGSFDCQKCSNYWLLLTPVFMLAGVLLVVSLFVLNLTVVDGKLNGFILYTNLVAGNNYSVFASKGNVLFVLISLFNLDLGIETCFYHGMTEYAKTWLQFAFPTYLLSIVAILTIASRYSSSVEKLTRRRVIPVIATIFLLTYNKLLLATAKVLCSYRTVYSLPDNENTIIWIWDSSIPLLGIKFLILLIFCLLVFFIIIFPFNLLLLFTKFSYRFKFVAEYLKPFLDAYQAPLKSNCHYYFGIELLLRPIVFTIGNRILDQYKTIAIAALMCIVFLLYICLVKPFKSRTNTFLYGSYLFNATCLVLLVLYFNVKLQSVAYEILYNSLFFIAIMQFGGTVFYYLYINYLHRIKQLKNCFEKTRIHLLKYWNNKKKIAPDNDSPLEQLQEELLIVDPTH